MSEFNTVASRRLLVVDPCNECLGVLPHLQQGGWRVDSCALDQAVELGCDVGLIRLNPQHLEHPERLKALIGHKGGEWIAVLSPELLGARGLGDFIGEWFFDFHTLPFDLPRLQFALGRAYGMGRMRGLRRSERPTQAQELLGESPSTRQLRALIGKLALAEAPVLIRGESGTGKELIAKSLHWQSRRAAGPFVAINCGVIPEHLIQTELFGHEQGAFSGALERKIGRIEAASGGTLFLDGIGALSLELQAKLLRFLQGMPIERLGGGASIPVNVRVLAATHIDLQQAIEQGRFREDLYYRLNVLQLQTTPLRERAEDVPLLARHFSSQYSRDAGRRTRHFSESAIAAMLEHSWPGNVRELVSRVRRGLILAESRLIEAADLGLERKSSIKEKIGNLSDYLYQAERQALDAVLTRHSRNMSQAARVLGISRPTFYRLLHKHQIR